jgi:branched-chain amino acid transport system substrate-binding protein
MDMKWWHIGWLCLLSACAEKTAVQQRAEHLARGTDEVVIGVAWPMKSSKAAMADGVQLAADEINANGGVAGKRRLRLVIKDDEASLSKGRLLAQEFANDPQVSAVIGHLNTYVADAAAQIYERAGIVMVTPGSSGQKVTEDGRQYVFRSLPSNPEQARQIAAYAAAAGYKRIALYYIKNDYGVDLANKFEQQAASAGLQIADRRSYNMAGDNYGSVLHDWASFLKFDAIFLIGSLPESPTIIREAREAGITVPIFGGAGLDSPQLIKLGGRAVEGTVVFSLFDGGAARPEVARFRSQFQRKYGRLPDSAAAQGYDALHLVAQAMDRAGSVVPGQVAGALRTTRNWSGVTGQYTFAATGDLVGKQMFTMTVQDGQFRAVQPSLLRTAQR